MGAHQSRDQALYNHAKCGNVAGIKALRQHGAGLEVIEFILFILKLLFFLFFFSVKNLEIGID